MCVLHTHIYIHIHIYIYAYIYLHTHTHIYIYIYIHKHVYIYICICVCVYVFGLSPPVATTGYARWQRCRRPPTASRRAPSAAARPRRGRSVPWPSSASFGRRGCWTRPIGCGRRRRAPRAARPKRKGKTYCYPKGGGAQRRNSLPGKICETSSVDSTLRDRNQRAVSLRG